MKKKIIFFTLNFGAGGAEKVFIRLIEELYQNFELVIVTFSKEGVYYENFKKLHLKHYVISKKFNNTILYTLRLLKIIKKEKPYKIISLLYYPNIIVYLTSLFHKFLYIPCEHSNHQLYLNQSFKHKLWRLLLKLCYKKSYLIITVSNKIKENISKDFNISLNKIITIYNGIDFNTLKNLSNDNSINLNNKYKNIIAVGRITKPKNYQLLIESFTILEKKYNNLHLHIIGDGEQKYEIQKLINKRKLQEKIKLWGFIRNPYPLMKQADCYVLSSKWEGFPIALIEALYLNGHVVSTDCETGPSEIITHEYDGLLSPVDNAEKLAENIERMLFDEELRKRVYENSRISVKRFDEKFMIENYRKILE